MKKETTEEKLAYRSALLVENIKIYTNGHIYPVCPRCNSSMDREYQNFCDRCGQKLKWTAFEKQLK